MAGRLPDTVMKTRDLLFVAMCILCAASAQDNSDDSKLSPEKLEDTVFVDMLKIVDNKFDTLTTRITALEAAVSSLQFYSIRHFRQISGSLQSTGNDLENVRKQVTQLENEGQAQVQVVGALGNDMKELKKTSAELLSEFESSVLYINENLDKQGNSVKVMLEDTVIRSARETTAQLSKQIEEMLQQLDKPKFQSEPVSCAVDFTGISEHIDLRFAEFKMQTHAHFVKLINVASFDMRRGKRFSGGDNENDDKNKKEEDTSCDCKTTHPIDNNVLPEDNHRHEAPTTSIQSDVAKNVTNQTANDVLTKYHEENDERVMNALYNMTGSVLQAVSYFRNTGRLLEQILSNTDLLASQQTELTRRLDLSHEDDQVPTQDEDSDQSNVIPGADYVGQQPFNKLISGTKAGQKGCVLPIDVVNNVATIIKNGSQLLEVLTDLAQLSSVSMSKTTAALQDEVTRVEGIRTQLATSILARANEDESDALATLTNATHRTHKLVEAIASNTGRLPQIFHNIQQLESLTNRTLYTLMQNHAMLRAAQQAVSTHGSTTSTDQVQSSLATISTRISRPHGHVDKPAHGHLNVSSKDEAILSRDSLETIYSTSLQLTRIMPALTKLLSEPDPLVTLVGGGRPDQGRVEIYHNGLWGALCHTDLSHYEADLICRHLGFRGGISAGAGHFGSGAGVTWIFNASCLVTSDCPVVMYSEQTAHCSHELDSGVLCDHMLRIVSANGSTKERVGKLEIHHRGVWLPVCGEGWSGYSARVACQQMGFTDGREMEVGESQGGKNSTWLSNVACTGYETRLDVCHHDGWRDSCTGLVPAGVRCV